MLMPASLPTPAAPAQPGPLDHVVADLSQRYPLVGMALLHHENFGGGPISFKDWPYLVELYTSFDRIHFVSVLSPALDYADQELAARRARQDGRRHTAQAAARGQDVHEADARQGAARPSGSQEE